MNAVYAKGGPMLGTRNPAVELRYSDGVYRDEVVVVVDTSFEPRERQQERAWLICVNRHGQVFRIDARDMIVLGPVDDSWNADELPLTLDRRATLPREPEHD